MYAQPQSSIRSQRARAPANPRRLPVQPAPFLSLFENAAHDGREGGVVGFGHRLLARFLVGEQYWVNFARNGDPNSPGLLPWPRYRIDTDEWQEFNTEIRAESGVLRDKLDLFDRYYDRVHEVQ